MTHKYVTVKENETCYTEAFEAIVKVPVHFLPNLSGNCKMCNDALSLPPGPISTATPPLTDTAIKWPLCVSEHRFLVR